MTNPIPTDLKPCALVLTPDGNVASWCSALDADSPLRRKFVEAGCLVMDVWVRETPAAEMARVWAAIAPGAT